MVNKYVELSSAGVLQTKAASDTSSGTASSAGQIVALNASGLIDSSMLSGLPYATPSVIISATSSGLTAGDLVYITAGGVVAPADATSGAKLAQGWVSASVTASTVSVNVVVYLGGFNTGVTATLGTEYYLSDTVPGGISATPSTTTGSYVQSVGFASASNTLYFERQKAVLNG